MEIEKVQEVFDLTDLETEIISALTEASQQVTAQELKSLLDGRGDNVYRPLGKLVKMGLVEEINEWPRKYSVRNFRLKVKSSVDNRISMLQSLIVERDEFSEYEFLGNRTEYRSKGDYLLGKVKSTLDLIVSGSAQDEDFFYRHFEAVKRGVEVRCLITNYRKENEDMYEQWRKDGIEVKRCDVKGVNLIIYDSAIVQMAIKSSSQKKEKYGFVIDNEYLGTFFQRYFDVLWEVEPQKQHIF